MTDNGLSTPPRRTKSHHSRQRRQRRRRRGASSQQFAVPATARTTTTTIPVTNSSSSSSNSSAVPEDNVVLDFLNEGYLVVALPTASDDSVDAVSSSLSSDENNNDDGCSHDTDSRNEVRGCCSSDRNACVLVTMMVMVGVFALAELVGGGWTGSLALLSDAFHMLSDLISLVVGFVAIRLAKRARSPSKSYGWQRAEIIGALVNGVFLQAACLFIALEAISRFIEPVEIQQPWVVFSVGVAGLLVNLVGMALFFSHRSLAHHHHGHGHSHNHAHGGESGNSNRSSNLNMHGVFLHVLGDALGSVVVIATSIVYLATADQPSLTWRLYVDPLCSLLLALFILRSSVPLVRHSVHILMQSVPRHVDLDALRRDVAAVDGVLEVHALHVWQMTERRAVGSVHVACRRHQPPFDTLCRQVKRVLHRYDVHETAVQPEFVDDGHHSHRTSQRCTGNAYWCRYGRARKDSCCDMTSSQSES